MITTARSAGLPFSFRISLHALTHVSTPLLLKRGVMSLFYRVSREHSHRYAVEFRWNNRGINDGQRMEVAIEMRLAGFHFCCVPSSSSDKFGHHFSRT